MVKNEDKYNKLYDAAVEIYKYFEKDKGFFSGVATNQYGKTFKTYNGFTGAKQQLELKMQRRLTTEEVTMLSLAVGFGPTPSLTNQERQQAMDDLWNGESNDNRQCILFDKLVTGI